MGHFLSLPHIHYFSAQLDTCTGIIPQQCCRFLRGLASLQDTFQNVGSSLDQSYFHLPLSSLPSTSLQGSSQISHEDGAPRMSYCGQLLLSTDLSLLVWIQQPIRAQLSGRAAKRSNCTRYLLFPPAVAAP